MVRYTLNSRHSESDVCFSTLKARLTLNNGRSEDGAGMAESDPLETFDDG